MMGICYIDQIKDLKDKKVFIRVDFNVPQDESGAITEDTRIVGAVPTIRYAVEQGAKVVLASHLGRPKGEKKAKVYHGSGLSALIRTARYAGDDRLRIVLAMK